MTLKIVLLIFMLLHVITFTILIHVSFEMREQIFTMRNEYKDMLKLEIKTTRECFDKWGECVNAFSEAVRLLDKENDADCPMTETEK